MKHTDRLCDVISLSLARRSVLQIGIKAIIARRICRPSRGRHRHITCSSICHVVNCDVMLRMTEVWQLQIIGNPSVLDGSRFYTLRFLFQKRAISVK